MLESNVTPTNYSSLFLIFSAALKVAKQDKFNMFIMEKYMNWHSGSSPNANITVLRILGKADTECKSESPWTVNYQKNKSSELWGTQANSAQ
jgi:hypothetical protein